MQTVSEKKPPPSTTEQKIHRALTIGRSISNDILKELQKWAPGGGLVHPEIDPHSNIWCVREGIHHLTEVKVNTTAPDIHGKPDHKNCNKAYITAHGAARQQILHAQELGLKVDTTFLHFDLVRGAFEEEPNGTEHESLRKRMEHDGVRTLVFTRTPTNEHIKRIAKWILKIHD